VIMELKDGRLEIFPNDDSLLTLRDPAMFLGLSGGDALDEGGVPDIGVSESRSRLLVAGGLD